MNLNCVICGELFTSSSDVQITPCGHMYHTCCILQWFQRSKTCPQCRNKCLEKSIHKVFFNIADSDTSQINIGSLQEALDNNILKNNLTEKELNRSKKEIENLKNIQKNCMKTISGLENKLQENTFLIHSYSEQLKSLKSYSNMVAEQSREIKELKNKIDLMGTVESILTSTTSDAEKLVKECKNKESLATWVVALKRELRGCENKRTDLRNTLKVVQYNAQKETIAKKLLLEKVSGLESENYHLNKKLKELIDGNISDCPTSFLEPQVNNIPKLVMSPTKTTTKISCSDKIIKQSTTTANNNTPTLIMKNLKSIEESTSPYLTIKSSSIGLSPLLKIGERMRHNAVVNNDKGDNQSDIGGGGSSIVTSKSTLKKTNSDLSNKYSIFKKPRLATMPVSQYVVCNGFGGSERKLDENYTLNIKKNANLNNRIKQTNVKKINRNEAFSLND